MTWYEEWFNEDYLALYAHRSEEEAESQVAALTDFLDLQGKKTVLDVGCGGGRHARAFAKRGFLVTGVDLSTPLLDQAIETALRDHLEITFIKRDMRNLSGLGPFDLVVSFFTSFGYFETEAEDLALLKAIYGALRPGGLFFLDYLHPEYVRNHLVPHSKHTVQGETVHVRRRLEGDRALKEIAFPEKTYHESVRLYNRAELEKLLGKAGFAKSTVFSNYSFEPWQADGPRQLFLSKRPLT